MDSFVEQRQIQGWGGVEGGGHAPPFFAIPCCCFSFLFFFFCNHYEKLQTVLFEVELVINKKPLA